MKPIAETIKLEPLYSERVWGGRILETRFGRTLPDASTPYGESWEVVDRDEAMSIVAEGAYQGKTLHELWTQHRKDIFGNVPDSARFPLLLKILDARDDLSIQVHPPANIASSLNGEPKTEMWYIAGAEEDAKLYVGLNEGVTSEAFEKGIKDGTVADLVNAISVKEGDFIFIPSGRLHAIGAGILIYEIQQNSDTTYRVFDWNRVGLNGTPRELHVDESMKCIDFTDVAPKMDVAQGDIIASCDHFKVQKWDLAGGSHTASEGFAMITVVDGEVSIGAKNYVAGDFFLIAATATDEARTLVAKESASVLRTTIPS